MLPLGLSLRFEIDANNKRGTLIKIQLEITAAKPLEQKGLRLVAELLELFKGKFGDLIKIDAHTFIDSRQKSAVHLTENLLETLVQFLLGRVPLQFPPKFWLVVISERFFNPHGIVIRDF